MGLDSLAKYLASIYGAGNKKSSTEHRNIQIAKSVQDKTTSDIDMDFSETFGTFGYYAGNITAAMAFPRLMFPSSTTANIPLLAMPIVGGYMPRQLLLNNGFEMGTASLLPTMYKWTMTETFAGAVTLTYNTSIKSGADGTRCLNLSYTNDNASHIADVYQDILDVTAWGKALRLEVDHKINSGSGLWRILIEAFDGGGSSLGTILDTGNQGTADGTWRTYTTNTTTVIPTGTYRIRFTLRGQDAASGSTNLSWDNVYLYMYPSVQIPLFFGQDTPYKESYQTGAIRAFDTFSRTILTTNDLAEASDFRFWVSSWGTWATDAEFNGKLDQYPFAKIVTSTGSEDVSMVEAGLFENFMVCALIQVGASSTTNAGVVVKATSGFEYVSARLNGAPGTTTLSLYENRQSTSFADSSSFTTAAGEVYLIVARVTDRNTITAYAISGSNQSTIPSVTGVPVGKLVEGNIGIASRNGTGAKFLQFFASDALWYGSNTNIVAETTRFENAVKNTQSSADMVYLDLKGPKENILYRARVSTLPTSSDEAGITFRVKDANNYWKAYVTASAYKVAPVINGVEGANLVTDTKAISESNICVQTDKDGFTVVTNDPYVDEVMYDEPLAYYRLNEASGSTVADSSGYANTGTIVGTVTYGSTGALATDSDSCIRVNTTSPATARIHSRVENLPSGVTNRTLECWVKPGSTSDLTNGGVCGWPYNNGSEADVFQIAVDQTAGNLLAKVHYGNAVYVDGTTILNTSNFYHIVATYDGTNIRLYVNGSLEATSAQTLNTTVNSSSSNFNIMGNVVQANQQRDCYIDEVAVYGTVLTLGRIRAHYNAGAKNHVLLLGGFPHYDTEQFKNRTGFGLYIKGTTGRIKYPMVSHLDLEPNYKDFGHYTATKKVA